MNEADHKRAITKLVKLFGDSPFHREIEVLADDPPSVSDDEDVAVLWRGSQIAWTSGSCAMTLVMSEEDMENGEIPATERAEIRANRNAIVAVIEAAGFTTENSEEDEEESDDG